MNFWILPNSLSCLYWVMCPIFLLFSGGLRSCKIVLKRYMNKRMIKKTCCRSPLCTTGYQDYDVFFLMLNTITGFWQNSSVHRLHIILQYLVKVLETSGKYCSLFLDTSRTSNRGSVLKSSSGSSSMWLSDKSTLTSRADKLTNQALWRANKFFLFHVAENMVIDGSTSYERDAFLLLFSDSFVYLKKKNVTDGYTSTPFTVYAKMYKPFCLTFLVMLLTQNKRMYKKK